MLQFVTWLLQMDLIFTFCNLIVADGPTSHLGWASARWATAQIVADGPCIFTAILHIVTWLLQVDLQTVWAEHQRDERLHWERGWGQGGQAEEDRMVTQKIYKYNPDNYSYLIWGGQKLQQQQKTFLVNFWQMSWKLHCSFRSLPCKMKILLNFANSGEQRK